MNRFILWIPAALFLAIGVALLFRFEPPMTQAAEPPAGKGEKKPLQNRPVPAKQDKKRAQSVETATFGAGCFWHVEEEFRHIKGVVDTEVGFMGGTLENPTYKEVCTDRTGHAEVVRVRYDKSVVAYPTLLEVFWKIHDPTTMNRQGPDIGTQYRSAIFYHTPEQKKQAVASKKHLERTGRFSQPVVTEIAPASAFWRAEEYHQRYLEKNGLASCPVPG